MADNALYPPYAQDGNALDPNATPFRYAGNPVGWSSTTAPSYLSMPSGDPTPIVGWYGGHPVTAAMRSNALDVANAALQFGPADIAAIRAFHGSPYSFERFDPAKIGTGEGAQAYGHGLYFAEHEGTAASYRDALATKPLAPELHQAMADYNAKYDAVGDFIGGNKEDFDAAIAARDAAAAHLRQVKAAWDAQPTPTGSMYEVSLHADPEHFLDWDKPLSEQHPKVQDAIADMVASKRIPMGNATGARAYGDLASPPYGTPGHGVNDPAAVSEALQKAGIPGIRYLDAGSRAAGEGSRNYVVFSPDIIDIIRRYGIAGLIGGGAAAGAATGTQQQ